MDFFEPSVMGGNDFVVISLMIMKFGTGIKLDVFHKLVMSLLLHNYDVIIGKNSTSYGKITLILLQRLTIQNFCSHKIRPYIP